MKKSIDFRLSLDETLIIKGLAICLMLWHHLFYMHPEYGSFVYQTAQFGKLCVSLFLFVSAYGLTIQYGKIIDKPITETFKFQAKRFVKFYANYWVIFLIFVPIGIFVFGRGLGVPYGEANHIKMLIKDILGINSFQSYNITWWFNQLIICLYLVFPILYFVTRKISVLVIILWYVVLRLKIPFIPNEVVFWALHFSLGILLAQNTERLNQFLNRFNRFLLLGFFVLTFVALSICRNFGIIPILNGTTADAFLALNIAFLVILTIRNNTYAITKPLKFLGEHSINIYMIHTFIYYYWFGNFFYSFKYPIVIFVVLLAVCLIVSVVLEYLKKMAKLSLLVNKINQRITEKKSSR